MRKNLNNNPVPFWSLNLWGEKMLGVYLTYLQIINIQFPSESKSIKVMAIKPFSNTELYRYHLTPLNIKP